MTSVSKTKSIWWDDSLLEGLRTSMTSVNKSNSMCKCTGSLWEGLKTWMTSVSRTKSMWQWDDSLLTSMTSVNRSNSIFKWQDIFQNSSTHRPYIHRNCGSRVPSNSNTAIACQPEWHLPVKSMYSRKPEWHLPVKSMYSRKPGARKCDLHTNLILNFLAIFKLSLGNLSIYSNTILTSLIQTQHSNIMGYLEYRQHKTMPTIYTHFPSLLVKTWRCVHNYNVMTNKNIVTSWLAAAAKSHI